MGLSPACPATGHRCTLALQDGIRGDCRAHLAGQAAGASAIAAALSLCLDTG